MPAVIKDFTRSTLGRFLVLWIATSALGIAWAAATPMVASPDEPAHIIKAAAVVRGELVGEPADRSGFTEVDVPAGIAAAWSWTCTAYDASTTAACQQGFPADPRIIAVETSAGLYNPMYYAAIGWPTLLTDDPRVAIYAMRALSAVICGSFFALAGVVLLSRGRPLVALFAYLAVLTPTTVFLAGSVNPNALEIATASALTALLIAAVRHPGPTVSTPALIGIAVSGVVLANTRGLSPVWMGAIAIVALVAARPGRLGQLFREWRVWVTLAVLAAGVAAAGLWLLQTNSLANMGQFAGAGTISPARAFVTMLLDRSTDEGLIALFGWLDTTGPRAVYALWSLLALAVVLGALSAAKGRPVWATALALACFFAIPASVQAASISTSGYIWQGRYSLAIYAVVLLTAALALDEALPEPLSERWGTIERRAGVLVGSIVAVMSAFTVLWAIRRYAIGSGGWWGDLVSQPQWLPPLGWLPWPLLALLACGAIAVIIMRSSPVRTLDRSV